MRVAWVHPSWRDGVIDWLASDPDARRHFLARCGVDGVALALQRPLLFEDADWDALGDGIYSLCHEADEVEATQLLVLLHAAGADPEVLALGTLALTRLDWGGRTLDDDAVDAWQRLAARLESALEAPVPRRPRPSPEPAVPPPSPRVRVEPSLPDPVLLSKPFPVARVLRDLG